MEFERELAGIINRHNMEQGSGTADFILAKFLVACLKAFDEAVIQRGTFGNKHVGDPA